MLCNHNFKCRNLPHSKKFLHLGNSCHPGWKARMKAILIGISLFLITNLQRYRDDMYN